MLDVGANIGLMSLVAGCCVGPGGSVYAFGPHPEMFERLRRNCRINRAHDIELRKTALGSTPEVRTVFSRKHINIGSSSLVPGAGGTPAGTAPVVPLDEVVRSEGVAKIRILKVDVEGFEYKVLMDAEATLRDGSVDIVLVEYDDEMVRDDDGGSMAMIHELMAGLGYMATASRAPIVPW